MKKGKLLIVALVLVTAIAALSGCYADSKYLKTVDSYTFWKNDASQAIAQKNIAKIVDDHMNDTSSGKTKKVAILGFDGCRADALVNSIPSGVLDENNHDIYTGIHATPKYSALNDIMAEGGAYIAYAGGEKGTITEQHPSTAPGWASILTGEWHDKHGVTDNEFKKNMDYKTFLLKYAERAENPLKTTFIASWSTHFELTYLDEIEYIKANNITNMTYQQEKADDGVHSKLMSATSQEDMDIVFGIYELTDYNGHETGFGNDNYRYATAVQNIDKQCYEVLQNIKARPNYENEDWLILMTTDHGGIQTWHGNQTLEERTTWIVCNKPIDNKYYSANYDGYKLR